MKKFVAVLVALLFVTSAGLALAEGMKCECKMDKTGKGQDKRVERLAKELKLTEDQKAKVTAILKEDEPQMKALQDKMMADQKAIRDASDQKIKAVLTPDQAKQYDQIKEKHQKKMDKECKKCAPPAAPAMPAGK